jgi:hypothetical protein
MMPRIERVRASIFMQQAHSLPCKLQLKTRAVARVVSFLFPILSA